MSVSDPDTNLSEKRVRQKQAERKVNVATTWRLTETDAERRKRIRKSVGLSSSDTDHQPKAKKEKIDPRWRSKRHDARAPPEKKPDNKNRPLPPAPKGLAPSKKKKRRVSSRSESRRVLLVPRKEKKRRGSVATEVKTEGKEELATSVAPRRKPKYQLVQAIDPSPAPDRPADGSADGRRRQSRSPIHRRRRDSSGRLQKNKGSEPSAVAEGTPHSKSAPNSELPHDVISRRPPLAASAVAEKIGKKSDDRFDDKKSDDESDYSYYSYSFVEAAAAPNKGGARGGVPIGVPAPAPPAWRAPPPPTQHWPMQLQFFHLGVHWNGWQTPSYGQSPHPWGPQPHVHEVATRASQPVAREDRIVGPSTDQPESAVAEGFGNIGCIYVYIGKDADIDKVAEDLRNQAPTILFVCCYNSEAATRMQIALSNEPVDKRTRGDGETRKGRQARPSAEDFQVKFLCVVEQELIVAGRSSVVKEIDIKEVMRTLGG